MIDTNRGLAPSYAAGSRQGLTRAAKGPAKAAASSARVETVKGQQQPARAAPPAPPSAPHKHSQNRDYGKQKTRKRGGPEPAVLHNMRQLSSSATQLSGPKAPQAIPAQVQNTLVQIRFPDDQNHDHKGPNTRFFQFPGPLGVLIFRRSPAAHGHQRSGHRRGPPWQAHMSDKARTTPSLSPTRARRVPPEAEDASSHEPCPGNCPRQKPASSCRLRV